MIHDPVSGYLTYSKPSLWKNCLIQNFSAFKEHLTGLFKTYCHLTQHIMKHEPACKPKAACTWSSVLSDMLSLYPLLFSAQETAARTVAPLTLLDQNLPLCAVPGFLKECGYKKDELYSNHQCIGTYSSSSHIMWQPLITFVPKKVVFDSAQSVGRAVFLEHERPDAIVHLMPHIYDPLLQKTCIRWC